ncbi:hypothetical protein FA95DRAFT_1575821 [Auriscalpium vulgare]|uniref:Uncharacterized protein n=1 Tax=Auriscalpium vulgare TaxID=40419 RepID=A0ACB8RDQ1_9AGAM|nr:hypothetical protein FA95DRAFT_1575821 [Auriscalpium vulgare]
MPRVLGGIPWWQRIFALDTELRIIEAQKGCPMRCNVDASGNAEPLRLQDTSLVVLNVERDEITPDAMKKAVESLVKRHRRKTEAIDLTCEYWRISADACQYDIRFQEHRIADAQRRIQSHRQSMKRLFTQIRKLRKSVREANKAAPYRESIWDTFGGNTHASSLLLLLRSCNTASPAMYGTNVKSRRRGRLVA